MNERINLIGSGTCTPDFPHNCLCNCENTSNSMKSYIDVVLVYKNRIIISSERVVSHDRKFPRKYVPVNGIKTIRLMVDRMYLVP